MDMKIAPKVITTAAKQMVKSPLVKGAALGAATVKIADSFGKKNEEPDKTSGKSKAFAVASTLVGGAAILFLAGKASGASNKQAISKGLSLVKDGFKKLMGDAKGTKAGQKVSGVVTQVLDKAKAAAGKAKANPVVQNATDKIKAAETKIKESKVFKAASEKVKTKAGALKDGIGEKAKTAGSKAKGAIGEKAKSVGEKLKNMLAGLKGKKADAAAETIAEAVTDAVQ